MITAQVCRRKVLPISVQPALCSDVTTSFGWHFCLLSAIPPWAAIPSDFTSQAGSSLVKTGMGMPRTTKAAGGFPGETRVSQATYWQSWVSHGTAASRTVADPSEGDITGGRPVTMRPELIKTIFEERLLS